jgi:hypothetical protein
LRKGIHMIGCHRASGLALLGIVFVTPLYLLNAQAPSASRNDEGTAGGRRILEEGQPPVIIHPTAEDTHRAREARSRLASKSKNLSYGGGTNGIGVERAPKIYLVLWGSQWNNNDPSSEEVILQSFCTGVGGSSWLNNVTQYCQGVVPGTVFCNGGGMPAGNQNGMLAGIWYDSSSAAPSHPKQSQLAGRR